MEPEYLERLRQIIQEAEELIKRRREEIERAKRAGVEVGPQELEQIEFERALERMKREYGGVAS